MLLICGDIFVYREHGAGAVAQGQSGEDACTGWLRLTLLFLLCMDTRRARTNVHCPGIVFLPAVSSFCWHFASEFDNLSHLEIQIALTA